MASAVASAAFSSFITTSRTAEAARPRQITSGWLVAPTMRCSLNAILERDTCAPNCFTRELERMGGHEPLPEVERENSARNVFKLDPPLRGLGVRRKDEGCSKRRPELGPLAGRKPLSCQTPRRHHAPEAHQETIGHCAPTRAEATELATRPRRQSAPQRQSPLPQPEHAVRSSRTRPSGNSLILLRAGSPPARTHPNPPVDTTPRSG
jgi:hypothetical protein